MISRFGFLLAVGSSLVATAAQAEDAQLCLSTAELVKMGSKLRDAEKQEAHDACLRALSESSNVVQKYHLQEADFDIMGTRPKQP